MVDIQDYQKEQNKYYILYFMKVLTTEGKKWSKYAATDMKIRVLNNKINNILDKISPFIIILILSLIYLKY
jgi:hypothetical protein